MRMRMRIKMRKGMVVTVDANLFPSPTTLYVTYVFLSACFRLTSMDAPVAVAYVNLHVLSGFAQVS